MTKSTTIPSHAHSLPANTARVDPPGHNVHPCLKVDGRHNTHCLQRNAGLEEENDWLNEELCEARQKRSTILNFKWKAWKRTQGKPPKPWWRDKCIVEKHTQCERWLLAWYISMTAHKAHGIGIPHHYLSLRTWVSLPSIFVEHSCYSLFIVLTTRYLVTRKQDTALALVACDITLFGLLGMKRGLTRCRQLHHCRPRGNNQHQVGLTPICLPHTILLITSSCLIKWTWMWTMQGLPWPKWAYKFSDANQVSFANVSHSLAISFLHTDALLSLQKDCLFSSHHWFFHSNEWNVSCLLESLFRHLRYPGLQSLPLCLRPTLSPWPTVPPTQCPLPTPTFTSARPSTKHANINLTAKPVVEHIYFWYLSPTGTVGSPKQMVTTLPWWHMCHRAHAATPMQPLPPCPPTHLLNAARTRTPWRPCHHYRSSRQMRMRTQGQWWYCHLHDDVDDPALSRTPVTPLLQCACHHPMLLLLSVPPPYWSLPQIRNLCQYPLWPWPQCSVTSSKCPQNVYK